MENKKAKKPKPSKFATWWKWPLIVLVLSFFLSLAFGIVSEIALSGAGIAISVVVILVFILISIFADMFGVAVTAANLEPFRAMAARKVRGAKEAIKLIQNKEKVASIAADVIGDICGILAGAAGATITAAIILHISDKFLMVFLASLVSAVIAALTIFGKAFFKKYAMHHNEKIIVIFGKFLSIFHSQKKNKDNLTKKASNSPKNDKKQAKNDKKQENLQNITENKEVAESANDDENSAKEKVEQDESLIKADEKDEEKG